VFLGRHPREGALKKNLIREKLEIIKKNAEKEHDAHNSEEKTSTTKRRKKKRAELRERKGARWGGGGGTGMGGLEFD